VNTTTAATFAALLATLYAAHTLADHVLGQTDTQALSKAAPGWASPSEPAAPPMPRPWRLATGAGHRHAHQLNPGRPRGRARSDPMTPDPTGISGPKTPDTPHGAPWSQHRPEDSVEPAHERSPHPQPTQRAPICRAAAAGIEGPQDTRRSGRRGGTDDREPMDGTSARAGGPAATRRRRGRFVGAVRRSAGCAYGELTPDMTKAAPWQAWPRLRNARDPSCRLDLAPLDVDPARRRLMQCRTSIVLRNAPQRRPGAGQ
jgi:hypothetical protein